MLLVQCYGRKCGRFWIKWSTTSLIGLIEELYENSVTSIKINNVQSNGFNIIKAVKQECILSLILFNACAEHIMRKVLESYSREITIDGRRINNLRYADDILILAKSEIELLFITNKLRSIKEKYGLNNDY